ncbi:MAG: UvrB/UvrC motif-containing protein [Verrucomicrobiota bacterium]
MDLCETCAQNKGVTNTDGFSLADMLAKAPLHPVDTEEQQICPSCGYETSDFRQTGRLGCSHCYSVFAELVRPVLQDMHIGLKHTGKIPTKTLERRTFSDKINALKRSLEQAIAEEAYEDAAKYRDQIQALEKEELEAATNA